MSVSPSPEEAFASTVLTPSPAEAPTVEPAPPAWEQEDTVDLTTPDPAPAERPARGRVGPYEVIEELARGGMGAVYRARHTTLEHEVALKVLLAGEDASPNELARFLREARAAARLEHPGVVRIHDVGEHRGLSYLAMDLVRGRSLAARIQADGPLAGREAAAIARDVAEALAFAHANAILHRDLKPGNVLLADDGRTLLTDFGLAKDLESDEEHTRSGQILGTPSYMPPEQAQGRPDLVGVRADVYSLGATLYAMLVGRPPFGGPTLMAVLNAVERDLPTPPSQVVGGLDPDLETICLKCLEKEPAQRYPTARDLADDLTRYLEDRPIVARRPTPLERVQKWGRRNRRLARGLAAISGAALLVLAGAGLAFVQRLEGEKERAELALIDAEAASALAEDRRLDAELAGLEAELRRLEAERASVRADEQRAAAVAASAQAETQRRAAVSASALADRRRKRAEVAEGEARASLARSRTQADLTRRLFDVLLVGARAKARASRNAELTALLRRLEPPRRSEGDLTEPGLATQHRQVTEALLGLASVGEEPGQSVVALLHAVELAPAGAQRVEALARLALAQQAVRDELSAVRALQRAEAEAKRCGVAPACLKRARASLRKVRAKVETEQDRARLAGQLMTATTKQQTGAAILGALKSKHLRRSLERRLEAKRRELAARDPKTLSAKDRTTLAILAKKEQFIDLLVKRIEARQERSARRRPVRSLPASAVPPAAGSLIGWAGKQVLALHRAGKLRSLLGVRHYRWEDAERPSALFRVEVRLEPGEPAPALVLDIERRSLEGFERRARVVHRLNLDLTPQRSAMFWNEPERGDREASGRVEGSCFAFRVSGRRADRTRWDANSTFESVAVLLLPRLLALRAPSAPLPCAWVEDVKGGFDDRVLELALKRAGDAWVYEHKGRRAFARIDAVGVTYARGRRLVALSAAEAAQARAAADVLPEAEAALEAKAKTGHAWAMFAWGQRLEREGSYAEARAWWILAGQAGHREACRRAGEELAGQRHPAARALGLGLLERGAARGSLDCVRALGRSHRYLDEFAQARDWFARAVAAGAEGCRDELADVLVQLARREPARASTHLDEALRADPLHAGALEARARLRLARRELRGALVDVTKAIVLAERRSKRMSGAMRYALRRQRTPTARQRQVVLRSQTPVRLLRLRVEGCVLAGEDAQALADLDRLVAVGARGAEALRARFLSRTRPR